MQKHILVSVIVLVLCNLVKSQTEKCEIPEEMHYEPRYKIGTESPTLELVKTLLREEILPVVVHKTLPDLLNAGHRFLNTLNYIKTETLLEDRRKNCKELESKRGTIYGDTARAHYQCDQAPY